MNKPESTNQTQDTLLRKIKEQEALIEEQKNKITELDTENFQLKNLIDNLPGDIYWKDTEGIWSGVNKRGAESLLQIGFIRDRSDVIGKSDYQLFSKETADEYRKNDLEVMALKTEMTREEINQLPNGEKIIQLSSKRPLWDKEGNIVGVVGNTLDISYLKKIETELKTAIEKAEAANKAKTEFLENMRHDIRTPLTGIVGFADLLKMESDNPHNEPPRGKPRGIRGGVTASFQIPYLDFLHNARPPSSPRAHLPSKQNIHQTKIPHPTALSLVMETA